ncbi:NUDIX hydrolase [Roseinatronobacter sp.]|uniref:NUDIX hydrolase n=1 Tax=Roseinatronobacter sp. TaxID=1945755 RepID=UPI0025DF0BBA|nr:NUDIX hydrolase [Rhodobaca sp.]
MNVRSMPLEMLNNVLEFIRPAFVQAAALCLRDGPKGQEVLLVKTLQREHWITPKGWPMRNKSLNQAAAIEAWEEAGVKGTISAEPIGAFTYTKIKKSGLPVQCRPQLFRLDVSELSDTYPEAKKRTRKWFSLADAAEVVNPPELKALLQRLDQQSGQK